MSVLVQVKACDTAVVKKQWVTTIVWRKGFETAMMVEHRWVEASPWELRSGKTRVRETEKAT
jgi:hypothetical protein